jgi:hypothetical protein
VFLALQTGSRESNASAVGRARTQKSPPVREDQGASLYYFVAAFAELVAGNTRRYARNTSQPDAP